MKTLASIFFAFIILQSFGQQATHKSKYTGNLDMMNYISLSPNEKDIVSEILLIKADFKNSKQELQDSQKRLEELDKITNMSSDFKDILNKAKKKKAKLKEYKEFLISDIEEYMAINSQLTYTIYAKKLENKALLQMADDVNPVREYIEEANVKYLIAEGLLAKSDELEADQDYIATLEQANKAYQEAINNQRLALALCANLDLASIDKSPEDYFQINGFEENLASKPDSNANCNETIQLVAEDYEDINLSEQEEDEFNTLFDEENADTNNNLYASTSSQTEEANINLQKSVNQTKKDSSNCFELAVKEDNQTINKDLIFRIQIGAFVNQVDKKKLHGLSPIFIDQSDPKYTKALVGEHHSYKSAIAALRVIRNTTEYKDAFVVMYCNGVRKPTIDIMDKPIDIAEKNAYISYRNTVK